MRDLSIIGPVAVLGFVSAAHGGEGQTNGKALTNPWISLLASAERVSALADLKVVAYAENLSPGAGKSGAWEIRTADNKRRVARLPYPWSVVRRQSTINGVFGLSSPQLTRIGPIEDGEYLLAWYLNGIRSSNVVRFRIASGGDSERSPLLVLTEIESRPGVAVPLLGIRAHRHTSDDPAPFASDVAFSILVVDGQRHQLGVICWIGPDGPLPVGRHYTYIRDPRRYRPLIALRRGSVIVAEARVRGRDGSSHRSRPLVLALDRSMGEAWDRATVDLGPVPPPRLALSGTVIGCDGQAGRGHLVTLSTGGQLWETVKADDDGCYAFYNVPTGKYDLTTHLPGQGQPELVWHGVALDVRESQRLDLTLERRFSFSGRVTFDDGTPAVGHEVMATWPAPDGKAEYHDFAATEADGRYVLAAPYEVASFVGWGGKQVRRGVAAGRDRVDFVAKKPR